MYQGRPSEKTLVLASLDGSHLGQVGRTRAAVRAVPAPELVDAVVVVSDLGRAAARAAPAGWSNDSAPRRDRPAAHRRRVDPEELGRLGRGAAARSGSSRGCRSRSGSAPQAVLLERGLRRGPDLRQRGAAARRQRAAEAIDEDRLGGLGRATLRTLTALDHGPRPEHGPKSYLQAVSQVLPGWVLSLLAGIAPAAGARGRRWTPSRAPGAGTSTCCGGCAGWAPGSRRSWRRSRWRSSSRSSGATPAPPPAPVPPDVPAARRARHWPCSAGVARGDGARVLPRLAGWRRAPIPAGQTPDLGAGVALGLADAAAAILLWLVNPYAGLLGRARGAPLDAPALTRPLPRGGCAPC